MNSQSTHQRNSIDVMNLNRTKNLFLGRTSNDNKNEINKNIFARTLAPYKIYKRNVLFVEEREDTKKKSAVF